MAITGAIFKSLSFDGVTSREYGVYITGEAVFNAPEREVEMISIPGRNGDFAQDKGRFQNIEVTYPAGIFADNEADFAKAISEFRNFLCSRKGYCRLADEYNPDEYRMAVYKNGLEVDPKQLKAGEFEITFDCQPQRYLLSGEEPIDISEWTDVETETGQTVTIDALGLKSFSTPFEPSQDGTPWMTNTDEVTPYLFRFMPQIGQDYDSEVLTSIIGGSVAWNQLVKALNSSNWLSESGVTASYSDGVASISSTVSRNGLVLTNVPIIPNHKYYIQGSVKSASATNGICFGRQSEALNSYLTTSISQSEVNAWKTVSSIKYGTNDATTGSFYIFADGSYSIDVKDVQFIDLTALFGSAQIADYVYSLEQTTAGAGVAWLKSNFPTLFDGYHDYDGGSLKSVKTSAHETVGFNQLVSSENTTNTSAYAVALKGTLDHKLIPNISYCLSFDVSNVPSGLTPVYINEYLGKHNGVNVYIDITGNGHYYANFEAVDANTINAVSLLKYGRATSQSLQFSNVCLNISYDGTRDGEYEPYRKRSYALDADLELRGLFKLDATNHLYCDGDIYPPSGEITRKFYEYTVSVDGIYVRSSNPNNDFATIQVPYAWASGVPSVATAGIMYRNSSYDSNYQTGTMLIYNTATRQLVIAVPKGTTLAQAQALFDGAKIVYELAEPTTEQADPYQEVQIVDNYGTESFIDTRDVQIPVGHTSRFGEVYAINGWDEIGFSVASGEDQTDYTLDLDGTRYGGNADIISGDVELTWGHTDDYDGSALTGRWLSDRDVYAAGTSPSIGAEVAYELSTPQTVQVTPVEVDLYDGENTLSSDTGKGVTVEYGTPPGMIYNPTLFESSPLIITEGYGDIHIGSDTITLNSAVIGKVKISDANHASHLSDTTSVTFSLSSSVDTSLLNDGDDITLDYEGVTILKAALSGMNPTGHSITSKTGIITTASTQSRGTDSVAVNSAATGITFEKGTSQTKSGQVIARVVVNGENVTATTSISVAFNGSDTISISASISVTGYYLRINQTELGHTDVYGDSTVVVGAGERYIDLDIGEAYMIEDGQIISVDSTTALPPELPTLKPGETEITHDNTITALAVIPRWWKV